MSGIVIRVRTVGKRGFRSIELPKRAVLADLLKRLDLNPQTVVARVNGKIVVERERLVNGDSVELIPIVTGG